jgi:hypothetical protein
MPDYKVANLRAASVGAITELGNYICKFGDRGKEIMEFMYQTATIQSVLGVIRHT